MTSMHVDYAAVEVYGTLIMPKGDQPPLPLGLFEA